MAKYIFKGENICYTNTSETHINYGDIVPLKNCIAVAADDIAPQMAGTVTLEGCFVVPAKSDDVFEAGQTVYYNKINKQAEAVNTDDIVCGIAITPKQSGETTTEVKIGVTLTKPVATVSGV